MEPARMDLPRPLPALLPALRRPGRDGAGRRGRFRRVPPPNPPRPPDRRQDPTAFGRQLPPGTEEVFTPSQHLSAHVAADSVDVVLRSNFFEHLPDTATFLATLTELRSVLKPGGRLLALQPNIRFVGGDYWDFDHHLALTDRTLVEACTASAMRSSR
jgi:SAM-dependent methyltransferase